MSKELKIVKCSEADCIRAIKELLNLVVNDKKRFPILKNKFKKSVDNIYIQDGVINKIEFHDIDHKIMLDELNAAIESSRGYLERSEKKKNQLEKIVKLDFTVDDKPSKTGKTETPAKLTKKPKAPVEEKPKEPKEVKKVKNKNEEKAAKIKEDKVKAQNPEDLAIRNFVRSLSEKEVEKLVEDIKDAFKNDSRISVTMDNFVKNNPNLDDAAIAMLNSAYSRKPNNKAMAPIYVKFTIKLAKKETSKAKSSKAKGPVVKGLPKETKKPAKTGMLTEAANKALDSKKDKKEDVKTEVYESSFTVWTGILNGRNLKDDAKKLNIKLNQNTLEFFAPGLKTDIKVKLKKQYDDTATKLELIESYSKYYATLKEESDLLNHEAYLLSEGIVHCFNVSVTKNFIAMIYYALGIEHSQRKELIKVITNTMKMESGVTNLDSVFKKYITDTQELSQIQNYVYNRKIVINVLNASSAELRLNLFEFIGEYLTAALNILLIDGSIGIKSSLISLSYSDEGLCVGTTEEVGETKEEVQTEAIRYTITANAISFVFRNTSFNIQKTDENYAKIHEAVTNNNVEALNELVQTKEKIIENISDMLGSSDIGEIGLIGGEEIKIVDKTIVCGKRIFKGALSFEFIKYIAENNVNKVNAIKNFIWNASQNPSEKSVAELYDFVVKNKLKITPAGTILLYKWVQDNYLDTHSRTFLNKPGVTLKMERSKVNADRNQICSNGLHLCSYAYGSFGSKLLLCELNPKNSVSIPTDYNQSKMRCCEYTVLMDITEFVSTMNSDKDYLSKVENIHYNTKLIELDIMKMYPNVVRKYSINGLNGLSGSSPELMSSFGKIVENIDEAPVIMEVEEDTEDIKDIKVCTPNVEVKEEPEEPLAEEPKDNIEVAETPDSQVISEEVQKLVSDSSPTVTQYNPNELIEKIEESREEPEDNGESFIQKNRTNILEAIANLIETGEVKECLRTKKLFDHIVENPEAYKLDGIIISTIMEINGNNITNKEKFWELFRILTLDQISSCHISDDEYNNSTKHAPAQEVKNDDGVEVIDTPNKTSETIVSKVGNFFKKLF